MRRRRVCEKLALVPGKLDHATIAAYQVADRRQELADFTGDRTDLLEPEDVRGPLAASLAPTASCEDLTMRESPSDDEDITPTASCSLGSTPMGSGCSSLAVTPTHQGSHNVGSGH